MESNRETAAQVIIDVMTERIKQDAKWGIQDHDAKGWLPILTEEVGEAAKAMNENDPGLREELIQVAAVAMAWVEAMDRRAKG